MVFVLVEPNFYPKLYTLNYIKYITIYKVYNYITKLYKVFGFLSIFLFDGGVSCHKFSLIFILMFYNSYLKQV